MTNRKLVLLQIIIYKLLLMSLPFKRVPVNLSCTFYTNNELNHVLRPVLYRLLRNKYPLIRFMQHLLYSSSPSSGSDVDVYLPNAMVNRARQGKLHTPAPAHTKTRRGCTHLRLVWRDAFNPLSNLLFLSY